MKEWKAYIKDAHVFYRTLYPKTAIAMPDFADEKMNLTTNTEMTLYDLNRKLEYYTAWMAYLGNRAMQWKVVSEYVELLYDEEYRRLIADARGKTLTEKKSDIAPDMRELEVALLFAKNKHTIHQNEFFVSKDQRDLISRQLTSKGYELKGGN